MTEPKEIVNHVRAFIENGLRSKLALLLEVRYVDRIEKTSVGKIKNQTLRSPYSNLKLNSSFL